MTQAIEILEHLNAARAILSQPASKPLTLSAFLVKRGGVRDTGGDIAHGIGGPRARPGLINNKNGMALDDAAIILTEQGYFPTYNLDQGDLPDIDDVIIAITACVRGHECFSMHDDDQVTAWEARVEMESELSEMGISLDALIGKGRTPGRPKKYERRTKRQAPRATAHLSTNVTKPKGHRKLRQSNMNDNILHTIRTGSQLRAARQRLGLTGVQMAKALGVQRDNDKGLKVRVAQLEAMDKIPLHYGVIAECMLQGARPSTWHGE